MFYCSIFCGRQKSEQLDADPRLISKRRALRKLLKCTVELSIQRNVASANKAFFQMCKMTFSRAPYKSSTLRFCFKRKPVIILVETAFPQGILVAQSYVYDPLQVTKI